MNKRFLILTTFVIMVLVLLILTTMKKMVLGANQMVLEKKKKNKENGGDENSGEIDENDVEDDEDEDVDSVDKMIDINDLGILEQDSDDSILLKIKKLIKISINYDFSFPCHNLNKRQQQLIHQLLTTFIITLQKVRYICQIGRKISHLSFI